MPERGEFTYSVSDDPGNTDKVDLRQGKTRIERARSDGEGTIHAAVVGGSRERDQNFLISGQQGEQIPLGGKDRIKVAARTLNKARSDIGKAQRAAEERAASQQAERKKKALDTILA